MLQATADFRAFLGPELQAVTGDAGVIGEVSDMVQASGSTGPGWDGWEEAGCAAAAPGCGSETLHRVQRPLPAHPRRPSTPPPLQAPCHTTHPAYAAA